MAAVMQVLPSSSPAHILAKFGAPPDPTKPREVFRSEFNRKASLWEAKQMKLAFNNVPGQDFWVAPADKVDLAALAALYEKWGWDATLYDGAE